MNPYHKAHVLWEMDLAIREKQHRVKNSFIVLEKQLNMVGRIFEARDTISNDTKLLIYSAGRQTSYLLRYIALWEIDSVKDTHILGPP